MGSGLENGFRYHASPLPSSDVIPARVCSLPTQRNLFDCNHWLATQERQRSPPTISEADDDAPPAYSLGMVRSGHFNARGNMLSFE